jgi:hypothetical protein
MSFDASEPLDLFDPFISFKGTVNVGREATRKRKW